MLGVSTSTVWYKIKKNFFKKVYLAECGYCHMVDKDEVMKIVKESYKKDVQRLSKKESILSKGK